MDEDDIGEALSDLGVSSIQSSPPAEEIADGSNNANMGVALVASSANLNKVATNTNDPDGSAATAIVAQAATNPPARHTHLPRVDGPKRVDAVKSSLTLLSQS